MQAYMSMSSRHYYSIQHLYGAGMLSRDANSIERTNAALPFSPEVNLTQTSLVIGSVISSCAFMEAFVNELFCDASDGQKAHTKGLTENHVKQLTISWQEIRKSRSGTLDKYVKASTLCDGTLDKSRNPYQDVCLLVGLRNAFVHFAPVTTLELTNMPGETVEPNSWEHLLKHKFAPNALAGPGNSYFPAHCLGGGCASWAVSSALNFVDYFCTNLGIKPWYDHIRPQVNEFL